MGDRTGTLSPRRTKHKLYQSPVCVEETGTCSFELGGRAFLILFFFIKMEIRQWWGDAECLKDLL